MTVQTTYSQEIGRAFAGLIADLGNSYVVSRTNPAATQIDTVTIDTVSNVTLYTITVNGIIISFTSDASATEAEIRAGLLADATANAFLGTVAVMTAGTGSDEIDVTAIDDFTPLTTVVSAELSVATATAINGPIGFGLFVAKSATIRALANVVGASAVIEGVLAHTHAHSPAPTRVPFSDDASAVGNDDSGLQPGDVGDVLKTGAIWCVAEEAMIPTDTVFVRHTAGAGGTVLGAVRNDADTASAVQEDRAHIVEHDADLDLVLLQVQLP